MEMAMPAWYHAQGDGDALFTGLARARAHHIVHMYRTAECHPPACTCSWPAPAPATMSRGLRSWSLR